MLVRDPRTRAHVLDHPFRCGHPRVRLHEDVLERDRVQRGRRDDGAGDGGEHARPIPEEPEKGVRGCDGEERGDRNQVAAHVREPRRDPEEDDEDVRRSMSHLVAGPDERTRRDPAPTPTDELKQAAD